jgi:branched-chain amino acid transport system ATP-binding protein
LTSVLEIQDLRLSFGAVKATDGLSVTVHEGEAACIIGPNGAGKTTLLNLVSGYLRPDSGQILYDGRDIVGQPPRRITNSGVARTFQVPQLFDDLTVLENLLIPLAVKGGEGKRMWRPLRTPERVERARELLDVFDLGDKENALARGLSEGERKVLDIAMSFALEPRLMLLDEPTSSVSRQNKYRVMDTLSRALQSVNVTALVVEHDMEVVARYATRVLVLANGQITAEGDPETILSDPKIKDTVAGWG